MVLVASDDGDGSYHLPWVLEQHAHRQIQAAVDAESPPRRAKSGLATTRSDERRAAAQSASQIGVPGNLSWGAGMVREKDDDWWADRAIHAAGTSSHIFGDARASTPDSMVGSHAQVLRLAESSAAAAIRAEARREREQREHGQQLWGKRQSHRSSVPGRVSDHNQRFYEKDTVSVFLK